VVEVQEDNLELVVVPEVQVVEAQVHPDLVVLQME